MKKTEAPMPVKGNVAAAEDAAVPEKKIGPQWVLLLAELPIDPAGNAPATVIPDGRCVRVSAAQARDLVDAEKARYATDDDLSIGRSLARDLVTPDPEASA